MKRGALAIISLLLFLNISLATASDSALDIKFLGGRSDREASVQVLNETAQSVDLLDLQAMIASLPPGQVTVRNGEGYLISPAKGIKIDPHKRISIYFNLPMETVDRAYTPVYSMYHGTWLIFSRYFRVAGRDINYRFCASGNRFITAFGRVQEKCVLSSSSAENAFFMQGTYIAISSTPPLKVGGVMVISDERLNFSFVDKISNILAGAIKFYTKEFGPPESNITPVLIVQFSPSKSKSENPYWRGDQSSSNVIRLNFGGDQWLGASGLLKQDMLRFVAHEAFHIWNGYLEGREFGRHHPWLHEGGAEIVANTYLVRDGKIGVSDAVAYINGRINQCILSLRDKSVVQLSRSGASGLEYSCGTLFNAALSIKIDGNVFQGSIALWKEILASGRQVAICSGTPCVVESIEHSMGLGRGGFDALTGVQVRSMLQRLLTESGQMREASDVHDDDFDGTYLGAMINPLLGKSCKSGRYGFWVKNKKVVLDTNATCSIHPGAILEKINDEDIPRESAQSYYDVRKMCEADPSRNINFSIMDSMHKIRRSLGCENIDAKLPRLLFMRVPDNAVD